MLFTYFCVIYYYSINILQLQKNEIQFNENLPCEIKRKYVYNILGRGSVPYEVKRTMDQKVVEGKKQSFFPLSNFSWFTVHIGPVKALSPLQNFQHINLYISTQKLTYAIHFDTKGTMPTVT
jgi:hypothetical protein